MNIVLCCVFHELAHGLGQTIAADVLRVRRLDGLQNAPAVHEEVGDDVRMTNAGVFGLDVK